VETRRNRLPEDLDSLIDLEHASRPEGLTVACYTFPHYHRSALNDRLYGPGWTEYVLMRGGRPWYPGHVQPRQPLLGELDERDAETWDRYTALAASHGIDVLIWDWYWFERGPALHEALEEGFLRAGNRHGTRFAIMWTNHPWTILYPTVHTDGTDAWPPAFSAPDETPEDIWQSFAYLIARYLHNPLYWRLEGRPVVCIWDATRLRARLGLEGTQRLLAKLRDFAERLGHPGIHFHACYQIETYPELEAMGFDSYGSYQAIAQAARSLPESEVPLDYGVVSAEAVRAGWPEADVQSSLPFWPSVSPGWDTTPRFVAPRSARTDDPEMWRRMTLWGYHPMLVPGETPAAFKAFVQAALAFLNKRADALPVMTISCWNEWTEGHYLLPDTRFGFGMLEALKEALQVS
jgi:hypothetical protein